MPSARARATASSSSADLPIPAWPSTSSSCPRPLRGGREQLVDRAQGLLSFEKVSRTGASSDDWGALRQKTGEPP